MNKFWRYLSQTIIHPAKTFKQLLADPHHLRYGTQVVFLKLYHDRVVAFTSFSRNGRGK
jgi:hypothetical protein